MYCGQCKQEFRIGYHSQRHTRTRWLTSFHFGSAIKALEMRSESTPIHHSGTLVTYDSSSWIEIELANGDIITSEICVRPIINGTNWTWDDEDI